ncbi:MAG: HD domain-containing protein [Candidatus Cloacimonetes bacterium]|nr:HD domain-containing protein [Candidatus Cloacimonadota bacterium]MCF7814024.1 HD domain-containing protein [Candidatus Cloacimonadota bacterium]MCF7868072.1 HD domain-containing protein [Candidatus Cloacimonadota bacterium]MCF7883495.1 HD domain-containing protein [Candidatus Cloacimonadota bacterium]
MEKIVKALTAAMEVWDPFTAQHQKRVNQLAMEIAREMNLSEKSKKMLNYASLLHDIGKINLPLELLSKPGTLADSELNLIKRHSEIGFEILKKIEFPPEICQIVLQHHEKMNGKGYPRGLTGSEILLEARILMVANTVEAIASNRPYRPVIGLGEALNEVEQNIGGKYDNAVVDACLRIFRQGEFELDELIIPTYDDPDRSDLMFHFKDNYETDIS